MKHKKQNNKRSKKHLKLSRVFVIVGVLTALALLIFFIKNKSLPFLQQKTENKLYEVCRKKPLKWNKDEYTITAFNGATYILKIEEKNRDSWTAGLKPMVASEVEKGYTTCNFSVPILSSEEVVSRKVKNAPKGIIVSVGSKKDGIYKSFGNMTLGIRVSESIKSNKGYDVDKLFEHIADSYNLGGVERGFLQLILNDPLLRKGVEGKSYDYYITRLNGKEISEYIKDTSYFNGVDFISIDNGQSWTPVPR